MINNRTVATGLAVFILTLASPAVMAQQNPFIGTWKWNMAKSHWDPASLTPKGAQTFKYEASGNNMIKRTGDGLDAQGKATHTEYASKWDGKDYPTGAANNGTVSYKIFDANTVIRVTKAGGNIVSMERIIASSDGKTLTDNEVGYNAQGITFHHLIVSDKQ